MEPDAITRADGGGLDESPVVAVGLRLEGQRERAAFQNYVDASGAWRPHAEVDASPLAELGADRQAPRHVRRLHTRAERSKSRAREAASLIGPPAETPTTFRRFGIAAQER